MAGEHESGTETEKSRNLFRKKNGKEEDQLDIKCLTSRYISHLLLLKGQD